MASKPASLPTSGRRSAPAPAARARRAPPVYRFTLVPVATPKDEERRRALALEVQSWLRPKTQG